MPDNETTNAALLRENQELRAKADRLERQLAAAQENAVFYRLVAESAADWEYWVGPDKRFVYVSPACEKITGYPPQAFMKDPELYERIVHPEDWKNLFLFHEHLERREGSSQQVFRITTAAGEIRWISHSCQPMFDEKGVFLGRHGNNHDITERVTLEHSLKVEQDYVKRLSMALEATSDGVWDWDIATGETYFSPRYFTMLGYEPDAFAHDLETWEKLLHPEDAERVKKDIFAHVERGEPFDAEFRLKNAAGEWLWVLGRGKVMHRDSQGKPRRMVGTHTDIHERKLMLKSLQQHVEELESLHAVAASVAVNISLEDVAASALDKIMETLAPDLALLYTVERDNLELWGVRSSNIQNTPEVKDVQAVGECLCGMAAKRSEPVFSLNIHKDPRCTENMCKSIGICSYAAIPLMHMGAIVGVLSLGSRTERDFSQRESFLQSVAAFVSSGLANAKLHQQLLAHAQHLEKDVEERTEALKKFYNAVEFSLASIVITDQEGTIEYVNPFFTELTGYTAKEALGQNPRVLQSGVHDAAYYDAMWRELQEKHLWRGEFCNRKKNGTTYWEDAAITALLDEQGRVTHYVAVKADITERKRYELELRKFMLSVDNSPLSMIITNAEGSMEYVNPAFCDVTGYTSAEAVGVRPSQLLRGSVGSEKLWNEILTAVSKGLTWRGELPLLKKTGEQLWVQAALSPVGGENGSVTHYVAVAEDISDRKALEQLKEDVDRIMRHDLKTPLNGIIGLPELVKMEENLTKSQVDLLATIEDAGRKMLRMIDLSLDMFKMETGAYLYRPQSVDVLAVLFQIMDQNKRKLLQQKVSCTVKVDGALMSKDQQFFLRSEERLLYSLLANLLINAVDASPPDGEVRVDIATGDPATIAIHNAGAVPVPVRKTFFDKYSTHGKHSGSGLGSYSARLMAEAMGWELRMQTSDATDETVLTILVPGG